MSRHDCLHRWHCLSAPSLTNEDVSPGVGLGLSNVTDAMFTVVLEAPTHYRDTIYQDGVRV